MRKIRTGTKTMWTNQSSSGLTSRRRLKASVSRRFWHDWAEEHLSVVTPKVCCLVSSWRRGLIWVQVPMFNSQRKLVPLVLRHPEPLMSGATHVGRVTIILRRLQYGCGNEAAAGAGAAVHRRGERSLCTITLF